MTQRRRERGSEKRREGRTEGRVENGKTSCRRLLPSAKNTSPQGIRPASECQRDATQPETRRLTRNGLVITIFRTVDYSERNYL